MKTDRRGFFKFGAGAVVAAPVAAKQIGRSITPELKVNSTYGLLGGSIGPPQDGIPCAQDDWMKRELAEHTQRLASIDARQPLHQRDFQPVIAARIDGLRSVSPVNKARMMLEAREDLDRQSQRSWLQREIDSLKKRLGPLGGMLG